MQGAVYPSRAVSHSAAVTEDPSISRYCWVVRVLLSKLELFLWVLMEQVHLAFGVVEGRLSERGVVCLVPWP